MFFDYIEQKYDFFPEPTRKNLKKCPRAKLFINLYSRLRKKRYL